jgi:hypothetical protein
MITALPYIWLALVSSTLTVLMITRRDFRAYLREFLTVLGLALGSAVLTMCVVGLTIWSVFAILQQYGVLQ